MTGCQSRASNGRDVFCFVVLEAHSICVWRVGPGGPREEKRRPVDSVFLTHRWWWFLGVEQYKGGVRSVGCRLYFGRRTVRIC